MKRVLPILLIVLFAAGAWYLSASSGSGSTQTAAKTESKPATGNADQSHDGFHSGPGASNAGGGNAADGGDSESQDEEVRPASEKYKNADEALAAVKAGAVDYDDLVLEEFTLPGDDCSWCGEFYRNLKETLLSPDTKPDQRSYYAEILAVSGKPENIATLIDAAKAAPSDELRDIYTQAIELTVGKDDVVKYLGEQMNTDNQALRESVIAAVTNQGSKLAAETLYKKTVESGDPDGFYSLGIGLGELVPDKETIPYLQQLLQKRDQYSHLAVKSLLNGGLDGVYVVMDALASSPNPDEDRKMLKDAVEHVNYDPETEEALKKEVENPKSPLSAEFARNVLEDFKRSEAEELDAGGVADEGDEEAPMTSMQGQ